LKEGTAAGEDLKKMGNLSQKDKVCVFIVDNFAMCITYQFTVVVVS